jgi:ABC-type multidrug transport system fused ATPase/permease subunit
MRRGGFQWCNGKSLLKNIDVDIPRGRVTALCGPSGVGKSTLVKILDRRYELHEGEISVDETPVSDIELRSYRRHVATLPESVSIINGTIAENILLGRQAIDGGELLARIELLGLGRFMNRFPGGVFTLVGEEGLQISAGERQAIGLIRALYDLPDVLLIDEGINAVDAELAEVFYKTVTSYSLDHAVLLVSHQPRALLRADFVYLMDDGTIAEQGGPGDLLARDTKFAALFSADSAAMCPA